MHLERLSFIHSFTSFRRGKRKEKGLVKACLFFLLLMDVNKWISWKCSDEESYT